MLVVPVLLLGCTDGPESSADAGTTPAQVTY